MSIAIALVAATETQQIATTPSSGFRVSIYQQGDMNSSPLPHPQNSSNCPDLPQRPPEGSRNHLWIVSGGQTGVDRAALDTALSLFMPVRGWCPQGRLAEDGRIPPLYPLQETTSTEYAVRTEWNARDSDGTLVLAYGPLEGGTKLTAALAHKYDRPVLVINALSFSENDIAHFWIWIREHHIRILNVAGPRESARPGVVYRSARDVLMRLFGS